MVRRASSYTVARNSCPLLLLAAVLQLFCVSFNICVHKQYSTSLDTDGNRSVSNSPDIVIIVGYLVTELYGI